MDLVADLAEMVAGQLSSAGVSFDDSRRKTDPVSFVAAFFEYQGRRIAARPRRVQVSRELSGSGKMSTYSGPLANLKTLCESGGDLTPYQTGRLESFKKHDLLLSDWGIHHLHLGELRPGRCFCERTGDLLFAWFGDETAYFVQVLAHDGFWEVELLEVVEANWPALLDRSTLRGIVGLEHVPSSSEIGLLRRGGVQPLVQLRSGRVLASPGGGLTTAGTSAACMMKAQRLAHLLWKAEGLIRDDEAAFRQKLGIGDDKPIRLAELDPTYVAIIGEGGGIVLRIPIAG